MSEYIKLVLFCFFFIYPFDSSKTTEASVSVAFIGTTQRKNSSLINVRLRVGALARRGAHKTPVIRLYKCSVTHTRGG